MKTTIDHISSNRSSLTLKSLIVAGILGGAMAAQGAVVVRWSDPGGRDDIITLNQGGTAPTTYVDGSTISPAVSANYYPNNSGYTPTFNGSASSGGTHAIQERTAPNADRVQIQGVSGITAMYTWEAGTHMFPYPGDGFLTGITLEVVQRNGFATGGTVQFLLKDDTSQWHISNSFAVTSTDESAYQTISADATTFTWNEFTPHVEGVATIGVASDPSQFNVGAVGFYTVANSTSTASIAWRHFEVTAFTAPEPSTLGLLGIGGAMLMGSRRRKLRLISK